jgi:zinc transport system permease protein
MNLLEVFALPPLMKGLAGLAAAGIAFPLIGVFILRLHLVPLKFALMHGAFLGGALALALGLDPLPVGIACNLAIVLTLAPLARATGLGTGSVAAFFMALAAAAAFIVMYKLAVPAKDVFSLLWGNIFALAWTDLVFTVGWAVLTIGFVVFLFRPVSAVLFDREIAFSAGINEKLVFNLIAVAAGFTVTLCLKLLGALLLDAVLILPAVAALLVARSAKALFLLASVFGLVFALSGFAAAVTFDIPASAGVTVAGAIGFAVCFAYSKLKKLFEKRSLT